MWEDARELREDMVREIRAVEERGVWRRVEVVVEERDWRSRMEGRVGGRRSVVSERQERTEGRSR